MNGYLVLSWYGKYGKFYHGKFVSWYYKDGETLQSHHLPSCSLVVKILLNHSVIISLSLVNHVREEYCRIYSALGWLNIIIKKNM